MNDRTKLAYALCWLLLLGWTPSHAEQSYSVPLTIEDRVRFQRAIEEVYWNHRIWPKENKRPKPAFDAVLPEESLRARVEDYLKKSNALEAYWRRPITARQLQAELDRMARSSKQPEVLRELYAALGNDASVIAECLARPALANRLIRNQYAFNARFHGALKQQAEAELRASLTPDSMRKLSGQYVESRWVRGVTPGSATRSGPVTIQLQPDEWDDWVRRLRLRFTSPAEPDRRPGRALPLRILSPLQEDETSFFVTTVLESGQDHVLVATVRWQKQPFDSWWREQAPLVPEAAPAPAAYSLPIIDGTSCADDTWAPTAWSPDMRSQHTAVWTGSEMIIWGGSGGSGYLASGARYNPSTDTWTPTSTTTVPQPRYLHTAVWTGTEMIIWGGDDGGFLLNTGGRYDPSTDTWTPTPTIGAGIQRSSHTAVWTGSQMIIWGGLDTGGELNSGRRYNPSTNTWTSVTTTGAPFARYMHTAVWTGALMIIWGGINGATYLDTGGRYDPSTNTWTDTPSLVLQGRTGHTAVWTGSEMIVWGGFNAGTYFKDGRRYDPSTDSVLEIAFIDAPDERNSHTAVWADSRMIIWGGFNTNGLQDTGGRYDPATDTWAATSITDAPDERSTHTAVWTGSEMVVWGGSNLASGILNSGGRYDPVSDTWNDTATTGVPGPRLAHTAVWTGAEMIVWGGVIFGTSAADARYDPATNTWTALTTTNAPSDRSVHTAVWTGSEMIVWGGRDPSFTVLNTGGRYDPLADTWEATTTSGAPAGRSDHTAVWTGSLMVVWGGTDTNSLNTGGRYDPSTDSWTDSSTNSAPVARYDHTAVWTGSEMIAWGGVVSGIPNSGGRYNPSTDTWDTVSTIGEPDARFDHTAVWTGRHMIVWGGNANTPNTGGRYNPSTNTWTATSTAGAPGERSKHTAVWTGSEMILWSGEDSFGFLNTGGRYTPSTDSWTTTSTTGAPSARSLSAAVWTGTQMIAWGGSILNTGGRYCASVAPACPTITPDDTLPDGAVAAPYNGLISANGGTAPYTYALSGNTLPDGLSLNTATGGISGTPTVPGTFVFAVTATDTNGCTGIQDYTVNIACPVITLAPATLPDATTGAAYSQTVSGNGGTPPYTFAVTAGALPGGLSLNGATGEISGTPTATGVFNFDITTTDDNSCAGSRSYTVNVACPGITLTPATLPDATTGVAYSQTMSGNDGTPPYTFAVTAGALPGGLSLNGATGEISGTPAATGAFNFDIIATDDNGCAGSLGYTLNVAGPPCLYCDDFEDGLLASDWTYIKQGWSESGGDLVGTPTGKKAVAVAIPVFAGCLNCSVEARMQTAGGIGNKVWMLGWYVDKKNNVELLMSQEKGKWLLKQRFNGTVVNKAKGFGTILPNVFYDVVVSFDGTQFTVTVDGTQVLQMTPAAAVPSGTVGFEVKGTTARFGEIIVN